MKKEPKIRGRKPLPAGEKKVKVYILVKEKHESIAQTKIDRVARELNKLD